MAKDKKIMCFTHWDLDGIVSYLVLKWTFPKKNIEYVATTVQSFRDSYTKWLKDNDPEDYDMIFILDLGIYEDKDLIDLPNVFIVDHHPHHDSTTYKNAKSVIKTSVGSCCMLMYKAFKKLFNAQFKRPQVHLIMLADDFDSYKLEHEDSAKLNVVFWDTNDKVKAFVKSFGAGFNGFSKQQQNIIRIHDFKIQKIKDEVEVYGKTVSIQGKDRKVRAVFAHEYINEVADILIADYEAEVALIVNPNTDHVSYRRNPDSDVDLSVLAKKLGDGAGHEFSSGSKITDDFMEFTKTLEKI